MYFFRIFIIKLFMDLNRFFKFFKNQDSGSFEEQEIVNDNIETFREDTPVFKLGMFIRLSEFKLLNSLRGVDNNSDGDVFFMFPGMDITDDNKQEFDVVFNLLRFRHIQDLDLNNEMVIDSIKLWSEKNLEAYILDCLDYYESVEEYEKCGFLKKIQDIIQNS
jgi:NADH:ubiquinone oxidoreductase subunit C